MREDSSRRRGRPRQMPEEQRREALLDAALALFLDQGVEGTTVAQIAARAGVATGTVYLYAGGKEALVAALRARFREQMAAEVERLVDGWNGSFAGLVDALVDLTFDLHLAHRREIDLFRRRVPDDAIRGVAESRRRYVAPLAGAIRQAVARGEAEAPGGDPELLAFLLSGAIEEATYSCLAFGIPADAGALRTAARAMARKLLAPAAVPLAVAAGGA